MDSNSEQKCALEEDSLNTDTGTSVVESIGCSIKTLPESVVLPVPHSPVTKEVPVKRKRGRPKKRVRSKIRLVEIKNPNQNRVQPKKNKEIPTKEIELSTSNSSQPTDYEPLPESVELNEINKVLSKKALSDKFKPLPATESGLSFSNKSKRKRRKPTIKARKNVYWPSEKELFSDCKQSQQTIIFEQTQQINDFDDSQPTNNLGLTELTDDIAHYQQNHHQPVMNKSFSLPATKNGIVPANEPKKKVGRPRRKNVSFSLPATANGFSPANKPKRKVGRPSKETRKNVSLPATANGFSPANETKRKVGRPSRETRKNVVMGWSNKNEGISDCKQPQKTDDSKPTLQIVDIKEQIHDQLTMNQISYEPTEPLKLSDHPTVVISKYCKQMYEQGWATGTGGGMSIKDGATIYIAPSGVQKEMIQPTDIFECNETGEVLRKPDSNLKLSECTPLFMNAYTLRNAGAVIHSHGMFSVLASLLFKGKEFRITRIEMLKGIKKGMTDDAYKYDDTLVVPIIENTLYERNLTERMKIAMEMYPQSNAVLVRRHGVYIWGKNWQKAKAQAECYHYLFEIAVHMKRMGLEVDQFSFDEGGITDEVFS